MSLNTGTLVTAAVRPNDSNDKIATFFANEGKGGHHSYQTLAERNAIIEERREWDMLCSIGDTKITYQLKKGFKNTTITDNGNWIEYKSDSPESVPGLELWEEAKRPYDNAVFVGYADKIWQSTVANNNFVPGAIDVGTGLPNTAWKESTKDSMSHQRNMDSQLRRTNGTFIHADNIATILSMQFTAFVSKGGNNTTAAIGRMDLTYLTVQAAVNSGATNVIILGGTYIEQVQILSGSPLMRICLWFGAVIYSGGAYTIENGKSGLVIEGQAMFSSAYPIQDSAIINVNATGVAIKQGGNPGAVYLHLSNLYVRSEGVNAGAGCFYGYPWPVSAFNCKFYAARTIWAYSCQIRFVNCLLDSNNLIYEGDAYTFLVGLAENCHFNSVNGMNGSVNGLLFKGGSYKTTTGSGFNFVNRSQGFKLHQIQVTTQSHCFIGDSGTIEIFGSTLQSIAGMVYNANLYTFNLASKAEIRASKLICEASQTNCINNLYATNTNFSLINVQMNKGYNANVNGVIDNVLIEDTLTAF